MAINQSLPTWQHPVLPGQATQGNILLTTTDFTDTPQSQSQFAWWAMEDIIGVANVKMEYDEETNIYTLSKAKGHMDNEGEWTYDWEVFGTFNGLTEEAAESLEKMVYVEYKFETTSTYDELIITGVRKDGTEDTILDIHLASYDSVQALDRKVESYKPVAGTAIEIVDLPTSTPGKQISIKYNTNDFTIDSNGNLKANIINDTLTTSDNKTYSIDKILSLIEDSASYKGMVVDPTALPDVANQGDIYAVSNTSEFYINISDTSTVNWVTLEPLVEGIATSVVKDTTGIKVNVDYDPVEFSIDAQDRLKSELIDDNMVETNPLSNRKTWSIAKITQLVSSAFIYKGQVQTMNDLPSTLTTEDAGWTYNVVATGNDVVWNGAGWDILSGEYIGGVGIVINGKVINATGIAFTVGAGLQSTGSGTSAVLSTRIAEGLTYKNVGTLETPLYAIQVDTGNGLHISNSRVEVYSEPPVNLNTTTGKVELDYNEGLSLNNNNQLKVNYGQGLTLNSTNNTIVADVDNTSVVLDTNNKISTVLKTWTGTQTQYDAITTKDNNTIYMIYDEV